MEIQGKPVFVGHHKSRKERQPKIEEMKKNFTNIFVKNLDENITDEIFKQLFSQFGKITSAAIMHDDQGKSKVTLFLFFILNFIFKKKFFFLHFFNYGNKKIAYSNNHPTLLNFFLGFWFC